VPERGPIYQLTLTDTQQLGERYRAGKLGWEIHTIGPAAGGFVLLGETGEAADTCGSTLESSARG
jgi:hypothetical protein